MSNRYVLITPCRNEAEFARRTLDSVCAQTIPPTLWVIVDDGSTDETPAILAEYAAKFDFIRIVRREDRGKRAVGPGVMKRSTRDLILLTSISLIFSASWIWTLICPALL